MFTPPPPHRITSDSARCPVLKQQISSPMFTPVLPAPYNRSNVVDSGKSEDIPGGEKASETFPTDFVRRSTSVPPVTSERDIRVGPARSSWCEAVVNSSVRGEIRPEKESGKCRCVKTLPRKKRDRFEYTEIPPYQKKFSYVCINVNIMVRIE